MIKHREVLLDNVVMLSALYLDPRFSFELTKEQKQKAVKHICQVQSRLNGKFLYPQFVFLLGFHFF